MADTHTLRMAQLGEFRQWLIENEWEIRPLSKSEYEILRATKEGQWVIIYKKKKLKEFCSVANKALPVVKEWKCTHKTGHSLSDRIKAALKEKVQIMQGNAEYPQEAIYWDDVVAELNKIFGEADQTTTQSCFSQNPRNWGN